MGRRKENHDIVYFVKESAANEELRFSLRSVCENFPHRRVWFYGYRPSYLMPDGYVHVIQNQKTKWERTTAMIRKICENPEISDEWWLFNDDFFVMKRIDALPAAYNGDLYKHIVQIENRHGGDATLYTKQLRKTVRVLEEANLTTKNYALHMPILINKEKALATLDAFPGCPMFRCLYGNFNNIGGIDIKDCKITDLTTKPEEDAAFISTIDESFERGKAGEFIRDKFKEPCRFEL